MYKLTKTRANVLQQYEKLSDALAESGGVGVAGSMAIDALLFKVGRLESQLEQALNRLNQVAVPEREGEANE